MTGLAANARLIGVLSAAGAVGLGLLYMGLAGAPRSYLVVNAAALGIGLVALWATARFLRAAGGLPGAVTLALGAALLVTALFGAPVEGATRWVRAGALFLQPSLIVLPLMLVAFASRRDALATGGLLLAALALAIQPDRAMAGVTVAGLGVLALGTRDRWTLAALGGAVAAFAVTLVRADRLPAVPYVDGILFSSFDVGAGSGAAVLGGAALLILPALAGRRAGGETREAAMVFGAVWLAVLAAAALGNYPTPLVGYGGSAILGYLLSLSALPGAPRAGVTAGSSGTDFRQGARDDPGGDRLALA